MKCLECGASSSVVTNCLDRYHYFLTLEYTNPEYGAVHHLTVATFILQHPSQLSQHGWDATYAALYQFLVNGICPDVFRARFGPQAASSKRNWSFTKGPSKRLPSQLTWHKTILDIVETPLEQYHLTVKNWAEQVLKDAAPFYQLHTD